MAPDPAFDSLLKLLSERLEPADRREAPTREPGVTLAAVALLLRQGAADGAEILFIKRAERTGDPWSGHLAFPGGRAEEHDATLLEIAMREAAEEVGIDARRGGKVIGRLPAFRPVSSRIPSVVVAPFVAAAPEGAVIRLQPAEVQDAFWMPLSELKRSGRSASVRWQAADGVRELPAFPSALGPIWGITERILSQFLALTE